MENKSIWQKRNFCENIKKLRTKNNLTKEQMAKMLGISQYSLTELECGRLPRRINCAVLYAIHDNFGVMPSEMLTRWEDE